MDISKTPRYNELVNRKLVYFTDKPMDHRDFLFRFPIFRGLPRILRDSDEHAAPEKTAGAHQYHAVTANKTIWESV